MFFLFTGNFRGYGFFGSANFIPDSSPVKPKDSIPFHPKKKLPISQPSSKIRDHDFYALTRLNPPQKSSWKKNCYLSLLETGFLNLLFTASLILWWARSASKEVLQ